MDLKKLALLFPLVLMVTSTSSSACTRALRADPSQAVMVGRNMDWNEDMNTDLVVYPRGIAHRGATAENPVSWTSQYGSIVAAVYGKIGSDGMNEAGLGAHILWLNESNYGTRNPVKPGLSVALWMQYYLDNFKSVEEAVRFSQSESIQVTPQFHPQTGRWITVHLVLDDASGDSAVLEYIDGKLHIYHDKNYLTATNDPSFDKQLLNMQSYSVFGGDQPVPGSNSPTDRFVRAAWYTASLPTATSTEDELSAVLSVLNNAAQPYRVPDPDKPYASKTIWHSVVDLTNRFYYFQSTATLNLIKVNFNHFNLEANSPVLQLNLNKHPEYVGDVSDKFTESD